MAEQDSKTLLWDPSRPSEVKVPRSTDLDSAATLTHLAESEAQAPKSERFRGQHRTSS